METIIAINKRLIDYFGISTDNNLPIWRVVWSEDQYEKRETKYSKEGLELLTPKIVELPKYKQWIHNKYVLENLVVIPEGTSKELTVNSYSYEPLWVFEDKKGNALPPKWEVCQYVIDVVNAAKGRSSLFKYVDEEASPEAKEERLIRLEEELFGNESNVTDALTYKQGIVVPGRKDAN